MRPKRYTRGFVLRLTDEQLAELDQHAELNGRTRAEEARYALLRYLELLQVPVRRR